MSAADWKKLRDWLFAVFSAEEAEAFWQEQIAEARKLGLPTP